HQPHSIWFARGLVPAAVGLDLDRWRRRQEQVHARTKLREADAFAARHIDTLGDPGDDAPRNQTGEQPHADLLAGPFARLDADEHVFVVRRGLGLERVEVLARGVFDKGNAAGYRRLLDVDIEHREENGNPPAT